MDHGLTHTLCIIGPDSLMITKYIRSDIRSDSIVLGVGAIYGIFLLNGSSLLRAGDLNLDGPSGLT
eukprot:SAG22_NODE_918_length_6500_cov_4.729105_4_plen_66_part_00